MFFSASKLVCDQFNVIYEWPTKEMAAKDDAVKTIKAFMRTLPKIKFPKCVTYHITVAGTKLIHITDGSSTSPASIEQGLKKLDRPIPVSERNGL